MKNTPQQHRKNKPIPRFFNDTSDGLVTFDSGRVDEFRLVAEQATGTMNVEVNNLLIDQVACTRPKAMGKRGDTLNTMLALLHEIAPQNAIEGLLVTQMIGTHNLSMYMMNLAANPEQTDEEAEKCINRAVKLTRTFTAQVEALHKLRNGGQQKVTVEHVNVHAGGQAIVGNVKHGRGEGEPDAK